MTEQSEHLSSAQIENYGNRSSVAGPESDQRDEPQRVPDQRLNDQNFVDQQPSDQRSDDPQSDDPQSDDPQSEDPQPEDQRSNDQNFEDQRVEAHLADCPSCRNRLLDFHRAHLTLLSVPADPQLTTASTPECPSDEALRQLAAGLSPDALAAKLTQHAATCDHCGPLLKTYTEDFSDDFAREEQAALANLQSSSASWQKNTARQMLEAGGVSAANAIGGESAAAAAPTTDGQSSPRKSPARPTVERKPFFWKWILVPATAAVCVLVVFGIWYSQRDTPEKVEKLLAQAYTEQRTMEMRWPGAEWAKPDVTLGSPESLFSKPRHLFRAEDIIKEHQTASSDATKWLRASAEAEILEGHLQSAIELLDPVTRANPDSVPLILDLALAYSQQFKISHDPKDSLTVIDLLSRVLKKEPENRTALFNLAITYKNSEMWDQAVSTWKAYLQLDPKGQWADEAKDNLEQAQKKLHSRVQNPSSPPADAGSFLALTDADAAFWSEEYQDAALRKWLAKAVATPQSSEHLAITRLGQIFERNSQDAWWNDFLQFSALNPSGAEALSAAFVANEKGLYADAIDASLRAAKIFKQQRNVAGELRARYESVYSQRRFLQGANCLTRAGPLQAEIALTRYYWLQSQLGMEIAVCLNYVDKLKESDVALSRSFRIAEKSHLPIAAVRNIGFAQGLHNQRHRCDLALQEGVDGLRAYWAGPPRAQRIYQLYTGFSATAQEMGLWSAAEALMRHAVDILSTEDDEIQRGAALQKLANLLAAENDNAAAEAVQLEANQLFERNVKEPTSHLYHLNGKIELSELQLRRGNALKALATLAPVRELLSETDGYFVSLNFYRVSGNVNRALKRLELASSEYKSAIIIAERALPGLKTGPERLQWMAAADDGYRGLVRVLLEQHDPESAWKLWEWYVSRSNPENLADRDQREPHAAELWPDLWAKISLISEPPEGPARIVYAVFDDEVEVWTIAHGKLRATPVPVTKDNLERMVQQFSQACAQKDSPLNEVQNLGQDLFALLMQPVSQELPSAPIIAIELDRSLSGLPVEALRSPNGWYFGEKYPIVQSPGMLYERHLRPAVNLPSNTSFLLADAAAGSYLPGHDLELSTIQRLFPKLKVLGPKTDSAAIMTVLGQSAIFGFIGHGEPYTTGAALRISPNLLLKAEDFSPQTLPHVQLAVLAACSTGSSGKDGLLDNRSLVHAFLAGGVPGVVSSRWNVDSEATALLMSDLYDRLAHNQSAPTALFSARNQLLKTYSHPYYWAGFSVTGKAN